MAGGYELGPRRAVGRLTAAGNPLVEGALGPGGLPLQAWMVEFTVRELPSDSNFEIYHASILGPGGRVVAYADKTFFTVSEGGTIADYDPTEPWFIRKGQSVIFYFQVGTGDAPEIWIYLRQRSERGAD